MLPQDEERRAAPRTARVRAGMQTTAAADRPAPCIALHHPAPPCTVLHPAPCIALHHPAPPGQAHEDFGLKSYDQWRNLALKLGGTGAAVAPCIHHAHAMHTPCTRHAHTTPCTCHAHAHAMHMHMPCTCHRRHHAMHMSQAPPCHAHVTGATMTRTLSRHPSTGVEGTSPGMPSSAGGHSFRP